jgi:hypothetical protein
MLYETRSTLRVGWGTRFDGAANRAAGLALALAHGMLSWCGFSHKAGTGSGFTGDCDSAVTGSRNGMAARN